MTHVYYRMMFPKLVRGPWSFGLSPVGPLDGHPMLGLGVDFLFMILVVFGRQEGFQDEGPTVFFGLGFVISGFDKFGKLLVGDGCFVEKERIDPDNFGWCDASVERVGFHMPKRFGLLLLGITVSIFFSGISQLVGAIRQVMEVMWMMQEIMLFDRMVFIVKGGAKNVTNHIVLIKVHSWSLYQFRAMIFL